MLSGGGLVWVRAKLKLNPEKMEVLLVENQVLVHPPDLNGVPLPLQKQVRSLGIFLGTHFCLDKQLAAMARVLMPNFAWYTIVTLWLDYCNSLYVGLPLKMV